MNVSINNINPMSSYASDTKKHGEFDNLIGNRMMNIYFLSSIVHKFCC